MQIQGFLSENVELVLTSEALRETFAQQALGLLDEMQLVVENIDVSTNNKGDAAIKRIATQGTSKELKCVEVWMVPLEPGEASGKHRRLTAQSEVEIKVIERQLAGTRVVLIYKGVNFTIHM